MIVGDSMVKIVWIVHEEIQLHMTCMSCVYTSDVLHMYAYHTHTLT